MAVNAVNDHVYVLTFGYANLFDSPYVETEEEVQPLLLEAIQAIASAQRPWLKADGFEFVVYKNYNVMTKSGLTFEAHYNISPLPPTLKHITEYAGVFCRKISTSKTPDTVVSVINAEDIVAFKPISDSQESWDAVAHIEVAEVCDGSQ
jgi:hypothetical protein